MSRVYKGAAAEVCEVTQPYRPTNRHQCSTKRIKVGDAKPIYFIVDQSDPPRIKLAYPAKYGGTTTGELCDRITRRVNALLRATHMRRA